MTASAWMCRRRIVAYCKMFQHDLVRYIAMITGRDINRTGFQKALARMVEATRC